jgi:hypothetical protein
MAKGADEFLQRCAVDAAFRERLETDFDSAVREYDMSEEEKHDLREYLQSDRHRAIQGHATRVFEESLSRVTGIRSPDEERLIGERERRNLEDMLGTGEEEVAPARPPLADRSEKSCIMCGEPRPFLAWFKGWRRDFCPTHRDTTAIELMAKIEQDMDETRRWMRERGM